MQKKIHKNRMKLHYMYLSVPLDAEPGVVSGLRSDRGGDKRISSAPSRCIHASAAATVVAEGTAFIAVCMWLCGKEEKLRIICGGKRKTDKY